jgi:hypothetical protein
VEESRLATPYFPVDSDDAIEIVSPGEDGFAGGESSFNVNEVREEAEEGKGNARLAGMSTIRRAGGDNDLDVDVDHEFIGA